MTPLQKLQLEQSEKRQELNGLLGKDELGDDERGQLETLTTRMGQIEVELRAAIVAEAAETEAAEAEHDQGEPADPETRERLELRAKASIGRYVEAALRGRRIVGAEAELAEAAGCLDDGIPIELWTRPPEQRETEQRDISPAPGTVGVNLDVFRPAVFAPSVVDKLMVAMPNVGAAAVAKGEEVPEEAAAITVETTTPHRVGASLNLSLEDIASVGQANFESILRQNISLALSDELDDQLLNGAGDDANLTGFFKRLTDPDAPGAGVEDFDRFLAVAASGIDGLWATMLSQVSMVVGVDTYTLSTRTFRDRVVGADPGAGVALGDVSFADYGASKLAGWWCNSRMPAAASKIQAGILCRKGRSMRPDPMRLAVAPQWGFVAIDDIYTGARKGERRFVVSVLVGDLILVQPDAYAQVAFRVAA